MTRLRVVIVTLPCIAGCDTLPVLNPAGPQAARIASLTWFLVATCTVVYVLVIAALAVAVLKPHRQAARDDRFTLSTVGFAVGLSTLVLFAILVFSITTGQALSALRQDPNALSIKVTAKQWWWQFEYEDANPARRLVTANELHVPVGRTIALTLSSTDVIHSFWVPALHGKMDAIPDRDTYLNLRADVAGVFRGQCAEFCGYAHALMAFEVVAEPAHVFAAWLDGQLAPSVAPSDATAAHGLEVFLNSTCATCHGVRGTRASGRIGPDLTHVASRRLLAAGTIPNLQDHLSAWLLNPPRIKPGTLMPPADVSHADLVALVTYVAQLK